MIPEPSHSLTSALSVVVVRVQSFLQSFTQLLHRSSMNIIQELLQIGL